MIEKQSLIVIKMTNPLQIHLNIPKYAFHFHRFQLPTGKLTTNIQLGLCFYIPDMGLSMLLFSLLKYFFVNNSLLFSISWAVLIPI